MIDMADSFSPPPPHARRRPCGPSHYPLISRLAPSAPNSISRRRSFEVGEDRRGVGTEFRGRTPGRGSFAVEADREPALQQRALGRMLDRLPQSDRGEVGIVEEVVDAV